MIGSIPIVSATNEESYQSRKEELAVNSDFKDSIIFIKNVRNLVREKGLTNRAFEHKCRLSDGYLSRAIYNGRGISLQSAINMARELNASLDDMIVDQSDKKLVYWDIKRRMAMIELQIAELQAQKARLHLLMQNHDKEDRDSDEHKFGGPPAD